jgi:hypothetical protein
MTAVNIVKTKVASHFPAPTPVFGEHTPRDSSDQTVVGDFYFVQDRASRNDAAIPNDRSFEYGRVRCYPYMIPDENIGLYILVCNPVPVAVGNENIPGTYEICADVHFFMNHDSTSLGNPRTAFQLATANVKFRIA